MPKQDSIPALTQSQVAVLQHQSPGNTYCVGQTCYYEGNTPEQTVVYTQQVASTKLDWLVPFKDNIENIAVAFIVCLAAVLVVRTIASSINLASKVNCWIEALKLTPEDTEDESGFDEQEAE